jgi:hypothetical protein
MRLRKAAKYFSRDFAADCTIMNLSLQNYRAVPNCTFDNFGIFLTDNNYVRSPVPGQSRTNLWLLTKIALGSYL